MISKLLAATLVITSIVFAQPGLGFRAARMGLDDQLKLTPQQVEQIQKLRTAFQIQCIDLRADSPNRRAINATLDKIAAQRATLEKLQVGHHLEVRALLTDEQKKVFEARPFGRGIGMVMKFRAHRQGYRGFGRRW